MTEDKITSPEAVQAFGKAWGQANARLELRPGDRRRAGLQAVADLVKADRDAQRLQLAADVLAWTQGYECTDDDSLSAAQYDECYAQATKALADIDKARA